MTTSHLSALLLIVAAALAAGLAPIPGRPLGRDAIAKVLDDFHDAASKADQKRYFDHFDDNGVFLGTDATERWTKKEFLAYAKPFFDQGRGWTYFPRPGTRHIAVSQDGNTAWFDEALDNAKYGECRGTGVLLRTGSDWKIAQYSLSVPVPNDLLEKVVAMIREQKPKPAK
jgi:hypothetical protein